MCVKKNYPGKQAGPAAFICSRELKNEHYEHHEHLTPTINLLIMNNL